MARDAERIEVKVLKKRSREFLEAAQDDLEKNRVDLAAFHSEQAVQLALRYLLAREAGYYPRTHSIRRLFHEIAKIRPELENIYDRYIIELMEEAYISARYLPRAWSPDVVKDMVKAAEEILEELGIWS